LQYKLFLILKVKKIKDFNKGARMKYRVLFFVYSVILLPLALCVSLIAQDATPAPAPAAPNPAASTDTVKPEPNIGWPHTIELDPAKDSLAKTGQQGIITIADKIKKLHTECLGLLKEMDTLRKDLIQKIDTLNNQLDEAIQTYSVFKGKLKEALNPRGKN
jgi:hypothetical protein